jgi:hypothetical membrane protein
MNSFRPTQPAPATAYLRGRPAAQWQTALRRPRPPRATTPSTPASDPAGRRRSPPLLAYGGAAGLLILAVCVAVGGVLDTSYDPAREAMSALGAKNAEHPMSFTIGVIALGLGAMCMAFTFGRHLVGKAARATSVLLVLVGLAMGTAGLAREDCSPDLAACAALEQAGAVSSSHTTHELVSMLGFVCVVAAAFTLARALRRSDRTAYLAGRTKAVGFALVAMLVLLVANPVPAGAGVLQRVWVGLAFGWPAYVSVVATRALSVAPGSGRRREGLGGS